MDIDAPVDQAFLWRIGRADTPVALRPTASKPDAVYQLLADDKFDLDSNEPSVTRKTDMSGNQDVHTTPDTCTSSISSGSRDAGGIVSSSVASSSDMRRSQSQPLLASLQALILDITAGGRTVSAPTDNSPIAPRTVSDRSQSLHNPRIRNQSVLLDQLLNPPPSQVTPVESSGTAATAHPPSHVGPATSTDPHHWANTCPVPPRLFSSHATASSSPSWPCPIPVAGEGNRTASPESSPVESTLADALGPEGLCLTHLQDIERHPSSFVILCEGADGETRVRRKQGVLGGVSGPECVWSADEGVLGRAWGESGGRVVVKGIWKRGVAQAAAVRGESGPKAAWHRIVTEVVVHASLSQHQHILPLLEVWEDDGWLYLVLPWARHGSLLDVLTDRQSRLPEVLCQQIMSQVRDSRAVCTSMSP